MADRIADVADIVVFVVLTLIHVAAWWGYRKPTTVSDVSEREFAASTMSGTATAGITAVSILIPASLLVVQLGRGETGSSLPVSALNDVFRGTGWLLFSLAIGLLLIYLLPMRSQKYDVGKDAWIGMLFGPQLLALLIGIVHIVQGLGKAVYG